MSNIIEGNDNMLRKVIKSAIVALVVLVVSVVMQASRSTVVCAQDAVAERQQWIMIVSRDGGFIMWFGPGDQASVGDGLSMDGCAAAAIEYSSMCVGEFVSGEFQGVVMNQDGSDSASWPPDPMMGKIAHLG